MKAGNFDREAIRRYIYGICATKSSNGPKPYFVHNIYTSALVEQYYCLMSVSLSFEYCLLPAQRRLLDNVIEQRVSSLNMPSVLHSTA